MPAGRGEEDSRGVEHPRGQKVASVAAQQPSGRGAGRGPIVHSRDEPRGKIRLQAAVRVEREHITALRGVDSRVHGRGKPRVFRQGDDAHPQPLGRGARTVRRSVVDEQDLARDASLSERGCERNREVGGVVVGDDDDRDVDATAAQLQGVVHRFSLESPRASRRTAA